MIRSLLIACAVGLLHGCSTNTTRPAVVTAEAGKPVTILVSIDGFRPDYLGRGTTPNLDALAASGVRGWMRPSFPTKTFPNHYSMVTGLRPDRHGIVDNNMEDARRPDVRFSLGNASQALDPFWWEEAEPIWVTAEKQGIRTATMFWPGSEVAIHGVRPSSWQHYDENVTNRQRVESVIDWLRRPAMNRPQFVTLYFDTVDGAGHDAGPASAEVMAAVSEVDQRIGELIAELRSLAQSVNLVIVSDHGMAPVSPDRVIRIDKSVDTSAFRIVTDGPFLSVNPLPGREAEVERELLTERQHMQCWRKSDLPARFEYGRHPRVAQIFCLAEAGWLILASEPKRPARGGTHGYDNLAPDMAALFIGNGPAFAQSVQLAPFDNIAVYSLLAHLIGVLPAAASSEQLTSQALRR